MREALLFVSLVCVSAPLTASTTRGDRAEYAGGSVALPKGTQGSIDMADTQTFHFVYQGGTFDLPYQRIKRMECGDRAGVNVDSHKAMMTLGITALPALFSKKHLLTLNFSRDDGTPEAIAFEISKQTSQTLIPVLEARTGKHVEIQKDSDADSAKAQQPAPAQQPAAKSTLVPVTFMSNPPGARVSFYGQAVGMTPVTTPLAPGAYTVTIAKPGLSQCTGDFVIEPNESVKITADLTGQLAAGRVSAKR